MNDGPKASNLEVVAIYISPGHNFFGHFGRPPGEHSTVRVDSAQCIAGKGLEGDRFFDFKPQKFPNGYDGQMTFFSIETWEDVAKKLGVTDRGPEVFRRNVLVRGVDLNTLIGQEFEIQGVRFFGVKEAAPCEWMETAFAPGALKALKGRGGLRAKVLSDGLIAVTACGRVPA